MPDEQLDIFGNAVPFPTTEPRGVRQGERGGSAEAAKIPHRTEDLVAMLHCFSIPEVGPVTDDRLAAYFCGDHPGTISKRRLALERAGLIEIIPEVMVKTRRGVQAMTFRITDKGRQVLAEWRMH